MLESTHTMKYIEPFLQNLKSQNIIILIMIASLTNIVYELYFQIPYVYEIFYGNAPLIVAPLVPPKQFIMTVIFAFINCLIATIGLALFISKKGVISGALVGLFITLFFLMNAYFSSYITVPTFPTMQSTVVYFISLSIFYVLPGSLLGYFRKA